MFHHYKSSCGENGETEKKTSLLLAIGDGANDVSMIQAAHVGVGIVGWKVCKQQEVLMYRLVNLNF